MAISLPKVLGVLLILIAALYIPIYLSLTREEEDAIEDRIERIQNSELYVLLAEVDGYYDCPACSNGKFFLHAGEIYKFGVTMNPSNRYSEQELARWRLEYVVLKVAPYNECLIEETLRSAGYRLLPENTRRPKERQLLIPPGSGVKFR